MPIEEHRVETTSRFEPKSLIIPLIIIVLVIGTVIGILNYLGKRRTADAPDLLITTPADQEVVETENVLIEGNTDEKATVKINGAEVEVDNDNGRFSKEVTLNEGENTIGIIAEKNGKSSEATLHVTRRGIVETPQPITKQPIAGADLSNSGPENYFIPEISALSFAGAGWYASKKKLAKSIRK